MTIEIRRPESQSPIPDGMAATGLPDFEEFLMKASAVEEMEGWRGVAGKRLSGLDLIAAIQASPYREVDIEPVRHRLPIREWET